MFVITLAQSAPATTRNGRSDQVLVYERAFKLIGSDTRRNWLDNGRTEAVVLSCPVETPV